MPDTENTTAAVAAYLNPAANLPAMEAKASMQVAVDANPDFEAELRRASARTGVPLASARAFPDDVKRQAAVESHDYDELAAQFPSTTKFLADPENARIAHDDVQNMTSTESTIGPILGPRATASTYARGLLDSFTTGAGMAREGVRMQLADLFGQQAVLEDAKNKYGQLKLDQQVGTPQFQSSTASGVYSGLTSTLRAVPGLLASVATRSTVPMLATMGVQTEADAYGKYRTRGATAGQSLVGGGLEGAIEVITEKLPMKYLVDNMGKVGAGHFLAGLLAREIPGEQIATVTQDAVDTAIANPDKTWGQYMAERPDAAYQTLVATLTQAGIMEGGNVALQRVQGQGRQAQQAVEVGEALTQFNDMAAASKLRERDASTAQTFFQSLMQDGRDTVWITPQALADSGMLEQVAQALPDVANQLQQAADTGTDIRIPIADLMATLAGPELTQSIIPHLADEPGGFTPTSASEYLESGAGTQLAEEVRRTLDAKQADDAFTASKQVVESGFLGQLNTAGRFSPQVNQTYASMIGNFYAVQAAKLGITPEEMAAKYPLQVRAEALPGQRVLHQAGGTYENTDEFWNRPRPAETVTLKDGTKLKLEYANGDRINATVNSQHVGDLLFGPFPEGPGVAAQDVEAVWRRKGVATAMYAYAQKHIAGFTMNPTGQFVTPDGEALAAGMTSEKIAAVQFDADQAAPAAGERGSLTFADDITTAPSIITLLQGADLSTALHEMGHFFLEVLSDVSSRPGAPAEVVADMDAVMKWFGLDDLTLTEPDGSTLQIPARKASWDWMTLDQKRPHHEAFARGFEAYLFEGRAPVPELQGIFSRFRSWMVNVYKSLTALNVELTPEVRAVFDRMLASTSAIAEAEREGGFAGMFGTRPDFMTPEEWQAYRELSIGASQDAVHDLETRSLKDMQWLSGAKAKVLAALQRKAADKRKGIREEVSAEVMAEPVNQARNFLRRGLNPDGTTADVHKLAISALVEMYSGEGDKFALLNWEPLGYGKYGALANDGITPDMAAELFGFDSGDALVRTLLTEETAKDKIARLTDQRMVERYGELVDEQAITRAVHQAVHSAAHTRFLATELNALNKATGQPAVLGKAAQMYSEQIIARTVIKDLRPDLYTAAAKRAAKASEAAFKKGDLQTAAAEKQVQLVNTYAAKAAMDAREEIKKIATQFTKIANGKDATVGKTRDMDMVQATRAILAEFGIGSRGKTAAEYLASVDAYDPGMAAVLRDRIDASTQNAGPFKLLTVEQVRGLRDEIESLWYLAKRSRQMEVDGDLMDRADVQDQLRARLEEIGVPDSAPGDDHAITEAEVRMTKFQSLVAALRRVEAWADAKDGAGTKMGPFRKFIWNSIKDPADAYRADKAKYLKQLRALLEPIAPGLKQVRIAAPELGYTFGFDKGNMGKVELLHAILHTGNASNKKKLIMGRNWGQVLPNGELDTSRWDGFVQRMIDQGTLTKADFDFAQGVWDLMDDMKPAAQKAHREAFGRYFDEVTADEFTTPFGTYRGGYVPAMSDSRIVSDAKTRGIMEEENSTLMNALPSTSRGFTKARVEYNRPLLLDLRTLAQHIDKVLLFTHLEGPVRDVRRILANTSVSEPLHRIDPAAYDGLLIPWLNRSARQQVETVVPGANGLMRFFSVARSRAGMAAMFANVSNTAQQITGFSIAALKVKPSYLAAAAVDFIRSPRDMAETVAAASPYMSNRMENEVGAMTGAINDILLNPSVYEQTLAWTQKHTYFMQSAVDNVMGPIIWHGAYNQAMENAPAGLADEELQLYARRLADSAVRETQGSTLPEDISRIETGNAFVRIFSQFTGYFNMQANVLGTEFVKVSQDVGLRKGAGRGFYILLFGFLAPAWVAQAIALAFRGGPDDDDKDGSYLDDWMAQTFGWGTLRSTTAMVPVIGTTINAVANGFNRKPYDDRVGTSPAISMIESAASVPNDIYKLSTGSGSATKTVRDVATLISMTVGIPANALARPAVFATDVITGKAKPTGPVDVARGVITGTSSPASKGR